MLTSIRGPTTLVIPALYAVAHMQRGRVVDLGAHLAVAAAELSAESGLPMAACVILATARAEGAALWTQDVDFEEWRGWSTGRRAGGVGGAGSSRGFYRSLWIVARPPLYACRNST